MCSPIHNPSFSKSSPNGPGLMQAVTGAISLEDQNTLPETAQNEVDPRPFQMLPPDFHLTHQTTPPAAKSQAAGLNRPGSPCIPQLPRVVYERAVGSCPVTTVNLGGVQVHCLLDSGEQVSNITYSLISTSALEGANCLTQTSGLPLLLLMAHNSHSIVTWN